MKNLKNAVKSLQEHARRSLKQMHGEFGKKVVCLIEELKDAEQVLEISATEVTRSERLHSEKFHSLMILVGSMKVEAATARDQANVAVVEHADAVQSLRAELASLRTHSLQKMIKLEEAFALKEQELIALRQRQLRDAQMVMEDTTEALREACQKVDMLTSERCQVDDVLQQRDRENEQLQASMAQLRRDLVALRAEQESWPAVQAAAMEAQAAAATEAKRAAVGEIMLLELLPPAWSMHLS